MQGNKDHKKFFPVSNMQGSKGKKSNLTVNESFGRIVFSFLTLVLLTKLMYIKIVIDKNKKSRRKQSNSKSNSFFFFLAKLHGL